MSKTTLLLIDDDQDLLKLLRLQLEAAGYSILTANGGAEGLEMARRERPDLVVLDLMMPGMDGYEVCRELRTFSSVPVLMLTARTSSREIVAGLDAGADDYMIKPFNTDELEARVRALLRRAPSPPAIVEAAGGMLRIDRLRREVTIRGENIELTPTEYQLLLVLAERAGEVLPHQQLLQQVWGAEQGADNDSLKVYIWHLRRKLEERPREPQVLLTEWGVGYKLAP